MNGTSLVRDDTFQCLTSPERVACIFSKQSTPVLPFLSHLKMMQYSTRIGLVENSSRLFRAAVSSEKSLNSMLSKSGRLSSSESESISNCNSMFSCIIFEACQLTRSSALSSSRMRAFATRNCSDIVPGGGFQPSTSLSLDAPSSESFASFELPWGDGWSFSTFLTDFIRRLGGSDVPGEPDVQG